MCKSRLEKTRRDGEGPDGNCFPQNTHFTSEDRESYIISKAEAALKLKWLQIIAQLKLKISYDKDPASVLPSTSNQEGDLA